MYVKWGKIGWMNIHANVKKDIILYRIAMIAKNVLKNVLVVKEKINVLNVWKIENWINLMVNVNVWKAIRKIKIKYVCNAIFIMGDAILNVLYLRIKHYLKVKEYVQMSIIMRMIIILLFILVVL